MIEYFIWLTCVGYIIYLITLLIGWLKVNDQFDSYNKEIIAFTVIIPVRNEAKYIEQLLDDLENQETIDRVKTQVLDLCKRFPVYSSSDQQQAVA